MNRGDRIRLFWSRFSLRELVPFLGAVFCTFTADAIVSAARKHGPQQDDQTLLVLRRLA